MTVLPLNRKFNTRDCWCLYLIGKLVKVQRGPATVKEELCLYVTVVTMGRQT